MNIKEEVRKMKKVSPRVAALPLETRDRALALIKEELNARQEEIFAENSKDLTEAEKNGVAPAVMKRLKFNEAKLADVSKGIDQLIKRLFPVSVGGIGTDKIAVFQFLQFFADPAR